jgi:hypothetical protein
LAFFFAFIIVLPAKSFAQPETQKPARILFLVDASSSMLNDWTPQETRFKAASRMISALVDSIHKVNNDVAFAVRVFGNQYPAQEKNCYDTKLEVPFNLGNDEQIRARLKYLTPLGYSPIAWSLKETAEKDFVESNLYSYSIILITDGGESCGGDICATVKNLLEKKISFKPYILSLVDFEPLRLQYECLGKYLIVAKENDIQPAIKTIINDNRKILTIKTNNTLKQLQPNITPAVIIPVSKPVVPVVVKQEKKPEPVVVKKDPVPDVPVKKPEPVKPVVKPEPVIVKKDPVPVIVKKDPAPVVVKKDPVPVVVKKDPVPAVVKKEEPPKPVVPIEPPVVLIKLKALDRIASVTQLRRMAMLYTIPDGQPVKVPRLSNIKISAGAPNPDYFPATPTTQTVKETPKPKVGIIEPGAATPAKPVIAQVKKTSKKTTENLEFVVKTEDAKESTLQIYFTNGQGKFYNTEPKISIRDSKTGKEVKSLFRNVVGGEPTPIKLDPGTYDVIIPNSNGKASGIVVEPGKNKKYYIKVTNSSLAFYYPSSPDRPVKEYTALVSKRFEPGPVVKQKCDTELPYDPANYHIEINTLPIMILNVDLDISSVKLVAIQEAGTVQITNQNRMGKIQFWNQLGDTYVPFYEMTVDGTPATQKVEFLPGLYQVRFYNGPVTPLAKANVIMFRVKSNMTTSIELKN